MEGADVFSLLPEGCITNILSFTSPLDACSSSLVSSTFKSAADSDLLWEKFLPSDYKELLSRSVTLKDVSFSSKKEIYYRLCTDTLFLDDGKMSFNLERKSGKKCFMIGAEELTIVWGDTPHHWDWMPHPNSRFVKVAQLSNVCWLEVHGKLETRMLSPKTDYAVYLVVKFVHPSNALVEPPTDVSVEFIGGGGSASGTRTVYLNPEGNQRPARRPTHRPRILGHHDRNPQLELLSSAQREGQFPRERADGWMEIEMGELYNDQGEDGEVHMTLKEVKNGYWKGGLIIEGIELRPKGNTT